MPDDVDFLDGLLFEWAAESPGLDTATLGANTRVLRLANYLEKRADKALASLGLTLWQFEVLSTLLLAPAAEGMHVSELLPTTLLSPSAMTNRLDRLEKAGWIDRIADPADRRVTRICLTRPGRALTRRALAARGHDATGALAGLAIKDRLELTRLLRLWLRGLCERECTKHSVRPTPAR